MMLDLEGHHVGVWRLRVAFCESHDGSCERWRPGGRFDDERGRGGQKDGESNFVGPSLFQSPMGLAVLSTFEFCEISYILFHLK